MGTSASAPVSVSSGVRVSVKERYRPYLPPEINLDAVLNMKKVNLVRDHWVSIADEVKM